MGEGGLWVQENPSFSPQERGKAGGRWHRLQGRGSPGQPYSLSYGEKRIAYLVLRKSEGQLFLMFRKC